jgi:hypothetical protein
MMLAKVNFERQNLLFIFPVQKVGNLSPDRASDSSNRGILNRKNPMKRPYMNQKPTLLRRHFSCTDGSQFLKLRSTGRCSRILLVVTLAGACAGTVWAQDVPSGTITASGSGIYTYNLTFSDAASAVNPIGSVWYSWIPGYNFLPGIPSSASAPSGWTASISGNSIQFVASSSSADIAPGHSLSGFSFQASFSPATLASTPDSELSTAYSGGLFSDGGAEFTVQVVPEPSMAGLCAMSGLGLAAIRSRKKV